MAKRRQFYQLSPVCYRVSLWKEGLRKSLADRRSRFRAAELRQEESLPVIVKSHRSPVLRRLEGVDMALQQSKRANLALAAGCIDGVVIRPGESFSFWRLVGDCTAKKGYREGLVIKGGMPDRGVGGGMCQFTNLLHWMALHSPLQIVEHHHHNGVDLFPDYGRKLPFGCGTSILYNYRDYRLYNPTGQPFQFVVWLDETDLNGELRTTRPLAQRWHIREDEAWFEEGADGALYRHNKIYRRTIDAKTGAQLCEELLLENHARVMYGREFVPEEKIRRADCPADA